MDLLIEACEGGFYIAKIGHPEYSEKTLQKLFRTNGLVYKPNMRFQSLIHIRDYFEAVSPDRVWLEHSLAYDEMIGLPPSGSKHLQPLHWYGNGGYDNDSYDNGDHLKIRRA